MQDVRHGLSARRQRCPLSNPEAVLLVDHEHAKVGERRVQERVRPDRNQWLSGLDASAPRPPLLVGDIS